MRFGERHSSANVLVWRALQFRQCFGLAGATVQRMFWFGERHSPASPPRLRNVGYGRAVALALRILLLTYARCTQTQA